MVIKKRKSNKKLNAFFECFKFDDNFKKISESDKNDNTLNMIRSIRGILLIALVVSKSFVYIYHLPTKVFNETNMEKLINSYSFPLIYYGERFGKKMLYAISGFELTYILISYFDNIIKSKHPLPIDDIDKILPPDLVSQSTAKKKKKKSNQLNIDDNVKRDPNRKAKVISDYTIQMEDNEDKTETDGEHIPNPEKKQISNKKNQNKNNVDKKDIPGNDQKNPEEKEEEEEEEKEDDDDNNDNFGLNDYLSSQKKESNLIDSKETDQDDLKVEENEGKVTIKNDTEATKENEKVETSEGIASSDKENYYETYRKSLTIKDLFIWYSKHIYKYILFILSIFLFKYGTIYPFLLFQQISPMWLIYFIDITKKFNYHYIFANICLFSAFRSKSFYWINPFVLVYNEITFFIIGSFLFYICYKYCFEMNRVILILFLILLTTKIILGIFLFSSENFHYYPAMFYQYDNTFAAAKSYISSNQFMKLHIFLLGMFFGNVYYCLQNKGDGLENKRYLKLSLEFSKSKLFEFLEEGGCCPNFLQYIILVGIFVLYIVVINGYEMFIRSFMSDKNNSEYYTFFSNKLFNTYALFDGDFGAFLFLFIILFLFFIRENAMSKFIRHEFWRIIYKPYWSNLLLLHISSTFIFYYSENRIKFDFFSIIFFAFQILVLLTILSCIFFVLIEMPLRNLNKIIIKKFQGEENEDNKEDDNDDNKENNDNNDNDVDNDFN